MATKSNTQTTQKGGSQQETDFKTSTSARHAFDRVFAVLVFAATMVGLVVLAVLLVDIARDGLPRLSWAFLASFPSVNPANTGIYPALLGSLWLLAITAALSVPLGIGAAVYLEEYATDTWLNRLIEVGDGYVLLRDGIPRGYAISRLFGRGHVIGPVVAESPTDARALIEAALAPLGSVFVRIDTSTTSQLGEWLEGIGLQQVSDATTMVLGAQMPSAGPARTFALANQSFG